MMSGDSYLVRVVETEEEKRREEDDNNLIGHIATEEEKTKPYEAISETSFQPKQVENGLSEINNLINGILSGYPVQNEIIDCMNTSKRNADASESELDVDFQRVADNEKDSEVDRKSKKTKKKRLSLDERVKPDRETSITSCFM